MAFDPSKLDYKAAQKFLPRKGNLIANFWRRDFESQILDLLETGDFLQNFERYVGPLPTPGEGYLAAMEMIRKSYAPILKLREVLKRHVRGVIGKEPQFESVLEGLELPRRERRKAKNSSGSPVEALADAVDETQGRVWDEEGEHKILKQAVARLCAVGSCFLRYDFPPGLLIDGVDRNTGLDAQGVAADTWQDAYEQIYLELAPRGSAAVYLDPFTRRKTAFYSYMEPVPGTETKTRRAIQISWVDENDITQVRVVRHGSQEVDEWGVETGGTLLVVDALTEPLLTPDLLQLQDILCSIATNIKINSDVAGHPQMTLIDIAPPVVEVPAPTEANPDAKKRVPTAIETGPRTVQTLYSYVAKDKEGKPLVGTDGKPIIKQGSLEYREPVSSEPLRADIDFFALEIYSAVNQRHVPARASANASAAMLAEMRADFADSLLETKPDVEKVLRTVLKARLCLAAFAAGDTDALSQFKGGRVRVDLRLNAGPISVEEQAAIIAMRDARLISDETAMVLLSAVDDVEAEIDKLGEENRTASGLNKTPTPKANAPTSPVKLEVV
ncbi:MAG: phage portal protein [Armatimonadetes bacterium]|nr:phage portal protein [Armatimonadota bacterium]